MKKEIIDTRPLRNEKPLNLLKINNKLYIYQGKKKMKEIKNKDEFDFYYVFKYKQQAFDMINKSATVKNIPIIVNGIFKIIRENEKEK